VTFEFVSGWLFWVIVGWVLASACLGAALGRWFRWIR